jgi:pyruvate dehydrogenase kinase 2/3/4
MICKTTDVGRSIERAALDVTGLCERHYGRAPTIRVEGDRTLTFPYIPTYLHYILLELLKNAVRATAETHADAIALPPVTVVIADGTTNEDVVIKISDQGGGIPRSQMHQVWSYLYTTADPSVQANFVGAAATAGGTTVTDHGDQAPIAGLGYGLPIARSYARYFGGDLDLISMEGYGTDAYVHLRRLGDVEEPLPQVHFG